MAKKRKKRLSRRQIIQREINFGRQATLEIDTKEEEKHDRNKNGNTEV